MRKRDGFWRTLSEEWDLLEESLPGQSVVEITGDTRVLIENHMGVEEYGTGKISVKIHSGSIQVCGCGLELIRVNKTNLVIRGRIDCVTLHRRG